MIRIAVVILNWNRAPDTIRAAESILESTCLPSEIVIIDNGSEDDSVRVIQDWLIRERRVRGTEAVSDARPLVVLVEAGENLGFAAGCNLGVRHVTPESQYVLFLNNDALLEPQTLHELHDVAEESAAAITAPLVFDLGGERLLFSRRNWPGFLFGFAGRQQVTDEQWWGSDVVDGCAMLVRRSYIEERVRRSGWLFDPSLFLYWEDVDLSLDAGAHSSGCVTASLARVRHAVAASSGGAMNPTSFYYISRNRILIARRWLAFPQRVLFHLYYPVSRLVLQLVHHWRGRGGRSLRKALRDAILDGYAGRFGRRGTA
jgi:GT2 family glycosyltransferase